MCKEILYAVHQIMFGNEHSGEKTFVSDDSLEVSACNSGYEVYYDL